jgi:hypothetical protein
VVEEAGSAGQHHPLVEISTIMEATKTMAEAVNGLAVKLPHLNRIAEVEAVVEEEVAAVRAHHILTALLHLW